MSWFEKLINWNKERWENDINDYQEEEWNKSQRVSRGLFNRKQYYVGKTYNLDDLERNKRDWEDTQWEKEQREYNQKWWENQNSYNDYNNNYNDYNSYNDNDTGYDWFYDGYDGY